ncbi:MAG: hypothetical protein K6G61_06530 [Solobacterium sp.]|nr:hypothetical protein [Solobacterium sp.]
MIRSDSGPVITKEKAYRYYVGETDLSDPFFSDPKAYVTLNALLFEGITTETARIRENRKLDPVFLIEMDKTARLLKELDSLIRTHGHPKSDRTVWRVERLEDYAVMKRTGILQSFLSTSKNGFLDSYTDKIGLVLMTFHLKNDDPYIDAAEELSPYPKPEEAEITLPPFIRADFIERDPNEEEAAIRDRDGKKPAVICDVFLKRETEVFADAGHISDEDIHRSVRLYDSMNRGEGILPDDLKSYLKVKAYIRAQMGTQ